MGLPPIDQVPNYEPEELAPMVLEEIKAQARNYNGKVNFNSYCDRSLSQQPNASHQDCAVAARPLSEAWSVLIRSGLIAIDPSDNYHGWHFVTRKGWKVETDQDLAAALLTAGTPKEAWHPALRTTVYSKFIRGDYENAILEVFKLVEVSVRNASGLPDKEITTKLMRKAFGVGTGPLTDTTEDEGEQQALCDLFAGAMGRLKNPSSHRLMTTYDADTCRELLSFASFLLRVVDARQPK